MSQNPYQAPNANISNNDSQHVYAGFWIRFVASLIDTLFLVVIMSTALFAIYGEAYFSAERTGSFGIWDVFFSYIMPIIIVIVFWIYRSGTPGKLILGIKIVDQKTGGKLTVGQSVLRYIGYYISMLPLMLGFLWVAFDKKKQGWHDKISGTVCIKS